MSITDSGSPALTTTVSIRVFITFVNDHPPELFVTVSDGCEVSPADGGPVTRLFADAMALRKKRDVVKRIDVAKREASDTSA